MSASATIEDAAQDRRRARQLDEFHDPDLRFRVGFDVTLRGPEVHVSGQHLHVPE